MIEKNIVNNSNNKLINEGRGSEAALLKNINYIIINFFNIYYVLR